MKTNTIISSELSKLELVHFTSQESPDLSCKATFPLLGAHGTENIATVYFELEPGCRLGRHKDSAEELLVVLKGTLDVEIDGVVQRVSAGSIVLVPRMLIHGAVNVGTDTARVLGVFGGANNIVAMFENGWDQLATNVVDTSLMQP